jgi:hypothetical protein
LFAAAAAAAGTRSRHRTSMTCRDAPGDQEQREQLHKVARLLEPPRPLGHQLAVDSVRKATQERDADIGYQPEDALPSAVREANRPGLLEGSAISPRSSSELAIRKRLVDSVTGWTARSARSQRSGYSG